MCSQRLQVRDLTSQACGLPGTKLFISTSTLVVTSFLLLNALSIPSRNLIYHVAHFHIKFIINYIIQFRNEFF